MVSIEFVATLILLDVLFLCTFWTLRNIRRLTDARLLWKQQQLETSEEAAEGSVAGTVEATEAGGENSVLLCCTHAINKLVKEIVLWCDVFFGCILGYSRLEDNVFRKFPDWEPLPRGAGVFSTCALLIISGLLLSPEIIFGEGAMRQVSSSQLCAVNAETRRTRNRLEKAVNLNQARAQLNYTKGFQEALVNDTTLYGTSGYECDDVVNSNGVVLTSGKKSNWSGVNEGTFFPGYCEAALEMALFAAKNTECIQKVCGCNFIVCVDGLTEVCVDTPVLCDQHTNDQVEELNDYRLEQQRRASITKSTRFNVTSYSNRFQSVQTFAEDLTKKVMRQVDYAGTGYIIYSCLALFFPSPLVLFRTPIVSSIIAFVFGMRKHMFILVVVATWWGVEYFRQLQLFTPDLQLYVQRLQTNPCFADPVYIQNREKAIASTCMELATIESKFNMSMLTINNVLGEADQFVNTCDCPFPLNDLGVFKSPTFISEEDAVQFGFNGTLDNFCTSCDSDETILVPHENSTFLGNRTICDDLDHAREELERESNLGLSWTEAWVRSGIVAHLIIKFVVSNLCLDMLRAVDPFTDCGGMFEQPPERYFIMDYDTMLDLKNTKLVVLSRIALIRSLGWAVLMQWCVLSLGTVIFVEVQDGKRSIDLATMSDDTLVATILLAFVPVILLFACYINCKIRGKIHEVRVHLTDALEAKPVTGLESENPDEEKPQATVA